VYPSDRGAKRCNESFREPHEAPTHTYLRIEERKSEALGRSAEVRERGDGVTQWSHSVGAAKWSGREYEAPTRSLRSRVRPRSRTKGAPEKVAETDQMHPLESPEALRQPHNDEEKQVPVVQPGATPELDDR